MGKKKKIQVELQLNCYGAQVVDIWGETEVWFHSFLVSAGGGDEWLASRRGRLSCVETVEVIH